MKSFLSIAFLSLLALTASAQSGRSTEPRATVAVKTASGEKLQCIWLTGTKDAIDLECNGNRRQFRLSDLSAIEFLKTAEMASPAIENLTEKQRTAFRDAVLALRKLQNAASIGLSLLQYRPMLAETKTAVDTATMTLPDGELKERLKVAMNSHLLAEMHWSIMLRVAALPLSPADREKLLKDHPKIKLSTPGYVRREEYLAVYWLEAAEALEPLIELAAK